MKKFAKYTIVAVVVATAGLTAVGASAGWRGHFGDFDRCDRSEQRGGPGMMKNMQKPGRMIDRNLDLTADEARTLVAARLIMRDNDRLKVGQVAEKDENTYLVDVVTVDDSLVRQVEVDRDNGLPRGRFGRGK